MHRQIEIVAVRRMAALRPPGGTATAFESNERRTCCCEAKTRRAPYEAGEFTGVEDLAESTLSCSSFPSSTITGKSFIVGYGRFMQWQEKP